MVYWFFGLPGIGKDYCAKKLANMLACPSIDADDYLTSAYKHALKAGTFTSGQRLEKLGRICDDIRKHLQSNRDVTVADSLPDETSRQFISQRLGDQLVLIRVVASKAAHRQRLQNRKDHFFTIDLLNDYKSLHWQQIEVSHLALVNENQDDEQLEEQLRKLLKLTNNPS